MLKNSTEIWKRRHGFSIRGQYALSHVYWSRSKRSICTISCLLKPKKENIFQHEYICHSLLYFTIMDASITNINLHNATNHMMHCPYPERIFCYRSEVETHIDWLPFNHNVEGEKYMWVANGFTKRNMTLSLYTHDVFKLRSTINLYIILNTLYVRTLVKVTSKTALNF